MKTILTCEFSEKGAFQCQVLQQKEQSLLKKGACSVLNPKTREPLVDVLKGLTSLHPKGAAAVLALNATEKTDLAKSGKRLFNSIVEEYCG